MRVLFEEQLASNVKYIFKNKDYPLTRTLFLIIKQNGDIEEEAGKAYANLLLSTEGQEQIMKIGAIPMRTDTIHKITSANILP